ncbi:MAG: 4-(cytidine 5'-diphospho)-2-C-methyl-D-erythritol kinase [Candidatus Omnitrophota bacterium]|nr:4-(cytidine 5'-diphospho)-2-C-methyl-D-erythritol kinase [Candidatus Omnitrophota bacterium]
MRKTEILAPAKINLFLEVFPRPSGAALHPVETVIEKVTLFDQLSFQTTPSEIELRSNLARLNTPANLAFQAAALLKDTYRIKEGVRIRLDKKIPVASGLGGGSSDAAAVLLALNHLWKIDEPVSRLFPLALQLGSDVPAFLTSGRCRVSGFGEKVKSLPIGKKLDYLLVLTGIKSPTGLAYRWLDDLTYKPHSSKMMIAALKKGGTTEIAAALFNRFQEVLVEKNKEIKKWRKLLQDNFGSGLLSGSGGSFFVLLTKKAAAIDLRRVGTTKFSAVTTAVTTFVL